MLVFILLMLLLLSADYMRYAFGLVSDYLSSQWSESLKESLGYIIINNDIYKIQVSTVLSFLGYFKLLTPKSTKTGLQVAWHHLVHPVTSSC